MSSINTAGIRTALPRTAREPSLTDRQSYNRRNAFWAFCQDVGMYDPAIDACRPHTTEEIAAVFRVSIRTVQLGIASARRVDARCKAISEALKSA